MSQFAGPSGCLQYFRSQTSTTTGAAVGTGGQVVNYGQAATITAATQLAAGTTHLANQDYRICFRRFGNCGRVCLNQRDAVGGAAAATAANQDGFGLS